MSVSLKDGVISLSGDCRADDAEPLLSLLQEDIGRKVDLENADRIHAGILQILIAFRPTLVGSINDVFVRTWVLPQLMLSTEAQL